MKLSQIQGAFRQADGSGAGPIAPMRVVRLEPSDVSDTWRSKTKSGIAVGLRLLSDADETSARQNAAREAAAENSADIEATVEQYNSALRSHAVALAICDPNDVEKSHPLFPMAEDSVPEALTSRAITRLFDELEKLQIESSPLFPGADDEEVSVLGALLCGDEPLTGLPPEIESRVRRYLGFALSELLDFQADQLPDDESPPDP